MRILQDLIELIKSYRREMENLITWREELDGPKSELEKYALSAEEMEKYLEQVQRKNASEFERIHKKHQQELQAVSSKHVSELEDLKLLTNKQLEEKGQEVEKLRLVYDSEGHEFREYNLMF